MPHFRPFLPCILLRMPRTPNFTKVWGHPLKPQLHKVLGLLEGQNLPKSNNFWRCSGCISIPHFRPFLPCIFLRMSRNLNFTKFFGHQKTQIGPVPAKIVSFLEVVRIHQQFSMPHFGSFLQCVLFRMLENFTGQLDGGTVGR